MTDIDIGTAMFAVLTAFSIAVILGVSTGAVWDSASVIKKETVDVQSGRLMSAALALDSMPQGETRVKMEGYSYKYEGGAIQVKFQDAVGKSNPSMLQEAYDTIDAPSEFKETNGTVILTKTIENGDEVLQIRSRGEE